MKQILSASNLLAAMFLVLLLAGCSSPARLLFADREWHVSDYYGQIIDRDTTYRMTFGNVLIPESPVIVSSADTVAEYPGMDRFLADILHTSHLDSAEILFYAPQMQTMFVKPKGAVSPALRPSSISSPMTDEKPYTMWVNDGDIEVWTRNPSEMYTYTYFDKKKRRLLIVDCYDYGDTPMAQITIFQSADKATSRMKVPDSLRRPFYVIHDLRNCMRDIEFWAHTVETRRAIAFANYKIGQEQKLRKK